MKKVKQDETNKVDDKCDNPSEPGVSLQYILPQMINSSTQQLQSPSQLTMSGLTGTNINSAYNLLHSTPMQTPSMSPYTHLSPLTLNNLMLQSLLTSNQNITANNHNLEVLLGLPAQKMYSLPSTYPQINIAQLSLLNQLYYQQLCQNSLTNQTQVLCMSFTYFYSHSFD